MADPLTYANSDEYILVNPNDPKVGHLVYDAPMVDAETKQFIRDPETGKIKVYRMVIWGTKGLTQAQVESLISQNNATMTTKINNLESTVTNFLDADDTTLDQLSELITEIKANKANIGLLVSGKATKEELQQAVNTINTNLANCMDLASTQTVTGNKTFTGTVEVPTVTSSDNSTKAASTAFVQSVLGEVTGTSVENFVTKDTAQTITGTKTFTTFPVVAGTPNGNNDLVNKAYVDNALSSQDDAYSTSEIDSLLLNKANTSDVYTKNDVDTLFASKEDVQNTGASLPIGVVLKSSTPQNDINLYPANGAKFNKNGIYSDFVSKIKTIYDNSVLHAYTVNDKTIYLRDSVLNKYSQLFDSNNRVYLKDDFRIETDPTETPHLYYKKITETKVSSDTENAQLVKNYTVVGTTVTDANGVISGTFNSANYVLGNKVFDTSVPFEFKTKITPKSVGTTQYFVLFNHLITNEAVYTLMLGMESFKFRLYLSSNGSTWDIGSLQGTYVLTADVDVWIKVGWTGSEYYLDYSLDGEEYLRDCVTQSTKALYNIRTLPKFGRGWNSAPMYNLLDLNETSFMSTTMSWDARYFCTTTEEDVTPERDSSKDIQISDSFITNKSRYIYGTVGDYIQNDKGIISGFFSNTNFITFPFKQATESLELTVKFRQSPLTASAEVVTRVNDTLKTIIMRITNASLGIISCWASYDGASWNIMSGFDTGIRVAADVWNYIRVTWDGTKYTFYQSFDGTNWIERNSASTTATVYPIFGATEVAIGTGQAEALPLTYGQVDLHGCSLKIDNNLFWDPVTYLSKDKLFDNEIRTKGYCNKYVIEDNGDLRIPYITEQDKHCYVVVGGSIKSSAQINLDNYGTSLNNKVDRNDLVEAAVIVESYKNGDSWYRLWSDGWIEQGGYTSPTGSDVNTVITLLKEMADSRYEVFVNMQWNGTDTADWQHICAHNLTPTQFEVTRQGTLPHNWYVAGFAKLEV